MKFSGKIQGNFIETHHYYQLCKSTSNHAWDKAYPKREREKKKVYINYQLNKKNWGLIGYIDTRLMKEKKHCFCQTESHLNCVFDHVNDNCLSFYFC